ncbi:MAG: PAS domain S-box protein [Bacteroidales bacterium]|nr:PAS domain S-box protein [Bacteroidales bacterium]MCF8402943.1 PAS domain S-box protein [Bacteroidales bacterium]
MLKPENIDKDVLIEEFQKLQEENLRLRKLEDSLKKDQESFQDIFSGTSDGIILLDKNIKVLGVNQSFIDMTGLTKNEVVGKTGFALAKKFVSKGELFNVISNIKQLVVNKNVKPFTLNYKDKILEIYSQRLIYSDLTIGILKDISENVKTEQALKESQRQLATLMDNLPGMAYRCKNDSQWTMEFVSEGAYALTGYKPNVLVKNKKIKFANLIHPKERKMVWKTIQNAVSKKKSFNLTYRIKTAKGESKWVWEQGQGIFEGNGKIEFLEGFIMDITQRKMAEEESIESEKKVQSLLKLNQKLGNCKNYDDIVNILLEEVGNVFGFKSVWYAKIDKKFENISIAAAAGRISEILDDKLPTIRIKGDAYFEDLFSSNHLHLVEDVQADPRMIGKPAKDMGVRTLINLPVFIGDKIHGAIVTGSFGDEGVYKTNDMELQYFATIASYAATVISRIDYLNEKTQSENALRESEMKYRAIVNQSPLGIFYYNEHGVITECNNKFTEIIGSNRKNLIGFDMIRLLKDDKLKRAVRKSLKSGDGYYEDLYSTVTSGQEIYIRVLLQGITNTENIIVAGLGIVEDINERKKAEDKINELVELEKQRSMELRESLYQLQIAQDASLNMLDDLNLEIEERKKAEEELKMHRGNLENLVKKRTEALENSQASLALLLEDVNESREELHEANMKLEIANRDLESFAYSVSHDLRAPLRHIDGFAKMLKKIITLDTPEANRYYDKISESSKNMAVMIDSLLSFSRLGRKSIRKTKVDLDQLFASEIKLLNQEITTRKIEWKVANLPKINADETLVKLVIENLLSNALKFSSKKDKTIIEIGSINAKKNKCSFYIKDNGVGFDMSHADNLFGVFQRLHTKEEFEGTGIGLANVKQIVYKHGGDIWAESKIDEGATFFLLFPDVN